MLTLANKKNFFWLALLLHLLLLLGLSTRLSLHINLLPSHQEDKPSLYIPSYVYQEQPKLTETQPALKNIPTETKPVSNAGINKPVASKPSIPAKTSQPTRQLIKNNEEPIHLIGKNKLVKPLIKLLARALGQRLVYPKIAMDFNLRGTVYVSFIINPDGRITNIKLYKSSSADVLDEAGLKAVKEMSPVSHVSDYLKNPEPVLVGIIF